MIISFLSGEIHILKQWGFLCLEHHSLLYSFLSKIPEEHLRKIENESERYQKSYRFHYKKQIIIRRILNTVSIEFIGLIIISRPEVVYN